MNLSPWLLAAEVAGLVAALHLFFKTSLGRKVGKYWPLPFWVYFLSIVAAQLKILPSSSEFYAFAGSKLLAAAIFLMLVGAPVKELARMGKTAAWAMVTSMISVVISAIVCFLLFQKFLPNEGWKAVGAMVGTWVGGSANMLAVKEIVGLSDTGLAPLILVDTILSYTWLALLFLGAGLQTKFDRGAASVDYGHLSLSENRAPESNSLVQKIFRVLIVLTVGLAFSWALVALGQQLAGLGTLLSPTAWVLLLASLLAVVLALTPVRKLEAWNASGIGSFLLYMVLVTIGAKSQVGDVRTTPVYLLFGAALLLLHGIILFAIGWMRRWPLFLLSTASQAAVGGPVSAPIVANAYRPGTASIGVLMAIFGALAGTYLGVLSSWICRKLAGIP